MYKWIKWSTVVCLDYVSILKSNEKHASSLLGEMK